MNASLINAIAGYTIDHSNLIFTICLLGIIPVLRQTFGSRKNLAEHNTQRAEDAVDYHTELYGFHGYR